MSIFSQKQERAEQRRIWNEQQLCNECGQPRSVTKSGFEVQDVWKDLPTFASSTGGYPCVHLCDGSGKVKTTKIHKLVAKYFLGEPPNGTQVVRHLDSNPANNKATNLAYGTYLDNENDKIANGTWNTRNGGAKLMPDQVVAIRDRVRNGERQVAIAEEYGVSRPTVTRIVNNSIWKI